MNLILQSTLNYYSFWSEMLWFMFVPRKPSSISLNLYALGMFNENRNYYSLPLCSLSFTCDLVVKIINKGFKIFAFISDNKFIISMTHLEHALS
jgi:uncharacterized protein (DUF1810 family)